MTYLLNIFILLIFFIGCSHTHRIHQDSSAVTLAEMNQKLDGEECILFLDGQQQKVVKNILVKDDSTSWIEPDQDEKKSVSTSEVTQIVQVNRSRGATEGLGFGLLTGAAIFSIITHITLGLEDASKDELPFGIFGYGIVGGGAVALVNPLMGAIIGSKDIYVLDDKKKKSSDPVHTTLNKD